MTTEDYIAKWEAIQRAALAKFMQTGEPEDLVPGLEFDGVNAERGDTSVGESANWYWEEIELSDNLLPEIVAAWNSLTAEQQDKIMETERERMSEALNEDRRNDDPRI